MKNLNQGVLVLLFVGLVAIVGMVMVMKSTPQTVAYAGVAPVYEPAPAPQMSANQETKLNSCKVSYDHRYQLCNNRRHQESVDTCLAQAEALLDQCLAQI